MNDAEIINLVETKGTLPALKYIKDLNKEWSLIDCKRYFDKVMDNKMKQSGSITWFKCADKLPPIHDEQDKESKPVLIWQNGMNPVTAKYNYEISSWLHWYHWQPTHWAYINMPEIN